MNLRICHCLYRTTKTNCRSVAPGQYAARLTCTRRLGWNGSAAVRADSPAPASCPPPTDTPLRTRPDSSRYSTNLVLGVGNMWNQEALLTFRKNKLIPSAAVTCLALGRSRDNIFTLLISTRKMEVTCSTRCHTKTRSTSSPEEP